MAKSNAPAPAPTPNANPDAEVLDGKGVFNQDPDDAGGADDNKPAPKAKSKADDDLVTVKVGDQEMRTDAASAAVINALLQSQSQMEAFIKNGYKPAAAPPAPKADDFDYDTELFTNPKGAVERLKAEIRKEITTEMRGEYNAAESSKTFWNTFYSENADLKDEKLIVTAVLNRDWAKLKDMDAPKAAKHLAEATKKEIMRLSGGKSASDPDFRGEEGGSNKGPKPKAPVDDSNTPKSLSAIIRDRQEARRKAQFVKTPTKE